MVNKVNVQVAIIKEEIEMVGNQMSNLGFNMARINVPRETDQPYLVTKPTIECDIIDNRSNQQSLPILNSGHESMNQVCCSHVELQKPGIENETSQSYLDASNLESFVEELNQDYYMHLTMAEEFSAMNGR